MAHAEHLKPWRAIAGRTPPQTAPVAWPVAALEWRSPAADTSDSAHHLSMPEHNHRIPRVRQAMHTQLVVNADPPIFAGEFQ